ncbi:MAG: PAS domain S-box protein, partial [Cyanobacteria bacterium J06643_13]
MSQDCNLLQVNGDSSRIFKAIDGKITTAVTKMVVPSLQLPLNTALHRAKQEGEVVKYQDIKVVHQGETLNLALEVMPPKSDPLGSQSVSQRQNGNFFLVKIEFESTIAAPEIIKPEQFEAGNVTSQRLLELEQELQQTQEDLQTLVEELETTNEEQQAANEELTASNEELQSTNEELHSVNEELHTVNIEYQSKIQELIQLNDDIDNLLKSTEIGVIFLDAELKIRKFTPAVSIAVGLRISDLERPLEDLYWKFECPDLLDLLHWVLENQQPKELEVKLKRANSYLLMQINPYQTESQDNEGLVISFIKIDEIKQAQLKLEQEIVARRNSEAELRVTKQRVENIFSSLEDAVWSFDLPEGRLGYVNNSFCNIYGREIAELENNLALWLEVVHPEDRNLVEAAHQAILQENIDLEYRITHADGSLRWVRDRSKVIFSESSRAIRQDFIISDITARKNAQQALKEKELSFRGVFNSMFQFIGVLDPTGILLEANQTALEFAGLTAEEVLNRPFWLAKWWTISPETQSQLQQAIARAAQGEFVRYEVDVLGAEDRVVTIDFSLNPVMDESGKVVQLIHEGRDISELKEAREALAQTNQELEQRVIERTKSLAQFGDRLQQLHRLATSNYQQQQQDLFNDYLQTGCRMLNLGTGIVSEINDCVYKIVAVESPLGLEIGYETPCVDTYCAEVVETKTTVTFCEVRKIESMADHPVYLNLKLESFIGTPIFVNGNLYGTLNFSDTVPRQTEFSAEEISIVELMARDLGNAIASAKAKEAIRQKERRFRSTFEQAAVGVAHVSPDGKFILVNQRLCEIVGYDSETLLSKTFQEITYPEDLDLDLQYFGQLLAGEIPCYSMEKRYIRQDAALVWINLTVSLIRDSQGEADYFIAVIEDIGDRKQTESALEQNRNKLKQANLAKDNFIAHMSHELRTPLNSIIGFSHILQQDSDMTPEQLRSIDLVHQSGQHLLTLINDVLQLSKLNADKLQLNYCDFNLIELLHNI